MGVRLGGGDGVLAGSTVAALIAARAGAAGAARTRGRHGAAVVRRQQLLGHARPRVGVGRHRLRHTSVSIGLGYTCKS